MKGWELKKMIELFYADTPNGKKISIMLEEIKYPYKITPVDILMENSLIPNLDQLVHSAKFP